MRDKVTTVSPSYAGEILDPWYSHGLDDLLRQKQLSCAALNGIDVKSYDPRGSQSCGKLRRETVLREQAQSAKKELQEIFGLHDWPVPVVAMVTRLVGHKGVDLVRHVGRTSSTAAAAGGTGLGRSGLRELFQRNWRPAIRAQWA